MAEFKKYDAPLPAPESHGGGGFFESAMGALFSGLWALIVLLFDVFIFLLLSIIVVPSMLVMVWLHPIWEEKVKSRFHLGY